MWLNLREAGDCVQDVRINGTHACISVWLILTSYRQFCRDRKSEAFEVRNREFYMPMWLNWQSSWFVISRLTVRVRSSALNKKVIFLYPRKQFANGLHHFFLYLRKQFANVIASLLSLLKKAVRKRCCFTVSLPKKAVRKQVCSLSFAPQMISALNIISFKQA